MAEASRAAAESRLHRAGERGERACHTPERRQGRILVASVLVFLAGTTPAAAVIPGLAPGLLALLPSLLLACLAALTAIASPRAWWRLLIHALRRPHWTLATVLLVWGLSWAIPRGWRRLTSAPTPARPIATLVGGFPIGDRAASGTEFQGAPPPTRPDSITRIRLGVREVDMAFRPLAWRGRLVLVGAGARILRSFDAETLSVLWERRFWEPIVHDPIPFLTSETGLDAEGVILVLATRELVIIDGNGDERPRHDITFAPEALALIDERVVICGDGYVETIALGGSGRTPSARLPSEARVLAVVGDENRRAFALAGRELLEIPIDASPSSRILRRFEGRPRGLAAGDGLLFVFEDAASGEALENEDGTRERNPSARSSRVVAIDPSAPETPRWTHATRGPISRVAFLRNQSRHAVLVVADELRVLDADDGRVLATPRTDSVLPVAASSAGLTTISGDGTITFNPLRPGRRGWSTDPDPSLELSAGSPVRLAVDAGRVHVVSQTNLVTLTNPFRESSARTSACRDPYQARFELPLSAERLWSRENVSPEKIRVISAPLPEDPDALLVAIERDARVHVERWMTSRSGSLETRLQLSCEGRLLGLYPAAAHGWILLTTVEDRATLRAGIFTDSSHEQARTLDAPLVPAWVKLLERGTMNSIADGDLDGGREFPGGGLACDGELLAFATARGVRVLAFDSGEELWRTENEVATCTPLLLDAAIVLGVQNERGSVLRFARRETGEALHELVVPVSERWRSIACAVDHIVAVRESESGERNAVCALIDIDDPTMSTHRTLTGRRVLSPVRILDRSSLVLTDHGLERVSIDARAVLDLGNAASRRGPFVTTLGAFVIASGSTVTCIDSESLATLWSLELDSTVRSLGLAARSLVAVTDHAVVAIGAR